MINAMFTRDDETRELQLIVDGHSGTAPAGQDIVCSAASILVGVAELMTRSSADDLDDVDIDMGSGHAQIYVRAKDDDTYGELARVFLYAHAGYQILQSMYPDAVSVNDYDDIGD